MKKLLAILLALVLVLSLCACKKCEHEWERATCTDPKTCAECGETKGEALGHDWKDATCTDPKTCADCGKTKGEALGHTWVEATAAYPKTCTVCNATEGSSLGNADKLESPDGGGAVSMSYTKNVAIDLSEEKAILNFGNPQESNQDMQVQVVIQDTIIAQYDKVKPGDRIYRVDLQEDASKKLKTGGYEGKLVVWFYDRESGEKAKLHAEIPVTVAVTN